MSQQQGKKIVLPGGAGLVGQNLVARLQQQGFDEIVVIDKHAANLGILRRLHPGVTAVQADLAEPGAWSEQLAGADSVVMLQAQIGGNDPEAFVRNNVESTRQVLAAMHQHRVPYLVHVSSSVVESVANDHYTETKKRQETLVQQDAIRSVTLRPTLMFGWFDRKHLGWLSRFMRRVPVFPIPGNGRYMRQPLYAGDFCDIVISCLRDHRYEGVYNISGHEQVDYIDIIRTMKRVTGSRTPLLKIPYGLFHFLLYLWALFDRDPPFTTQQLAALVAHDEFEVIDWPALFGVRSTPFEEAMHETFCHPQYSRVVLEF